MNLIENRFVQNVEKESTWTYDVESRHFTANPLFYELLDFTPKKLNPMPKNWHLFLHPEECQAVKQQIKDQLKTNHPNFKVICRLHSTNQTWIWVLIRVQITRRDKHGQPQHLQGIVVDFTDIKLSEQLFQVQKQLIEKMIATTDQSLIGQVYLNSVFQIQELQAASIFTCDQHDKIELLVQQGFSIKTIDTLKQLKPSSPEMKQMQVHQPIIISATHSHSKFMKMLKLDCCQNGIMLPIWNEQKLFGFLFCASDTPFESQLIIHRFLTSTATLLGITLTRLATESQLRENESKYRLLAENLKDVVFRVTLSGMITYCSPASLEFSGFNPSEVVGTNVSRYIANKKDIIKAFELIAQIIAGKEISSFETFYRPKSGDPFPVEITAKAIKENGKTVALQCVMRNTTDRWQSMELMRLQRDLAIIFSQTSNLKKATQQLLLQVTQINGLDCGGLYLCNPQDNSLELIEHVGLSPEFVEETSYIDSASPQNQLIKKGKPIYQQYNRLLPQYNQVQLREDLKAIAILPISHDNQIVAVLNLASHTILSIPKDTRTMLETIAAQISGSIARIRAEEIREESEHREKIIFKNALQAILYLDDTQILEINQAAIELFKVPAEETLLNKQITELSPVKQPDGSNSIDTIQLVLQKALIKGYHDFYWTFQNRAGDQFQAHIMLLALWHNERRILQATIQDMSEKNILEQQLLQSQKMEVIGRLTGGIAHDFSNILVAITLQAEVLKGKIPSDQPGYKLIDQIIDTVDRGSVLAKQLLSFSKPKQHKLVPANLNDIILNLMPLLQRLINRTIDLKTDLAAKLELILADPTQIEQIIMNLVVNARDASPDNGSVTISTNAIELNQDEATKYGWLQNGEYVQLSVTDSGHGMDANVLNHVFEPFFTTKKEDQGTGLGLSLVYTMVKQHHGFIFAESEPGQGTEFNILLPIHHINATIEPPVSDK